MRKAYIVIVLGVLVAILPYLGFPYSWKDNIGTVLGLLITIFSYFIFRESKKKETPETKKNFDNFLENYDFEENASPQKESESTHIRI